MGKLFKEFWSYLFLFLVLQNCLTQNVPFGSRMLKYDSAATLPNVDSQTEMDQKVKAFYETYKQKYLVETCGNYIVQFTDGPNTSVSEGIGYGMIITTMMAGADPEAQKIFDGLYYHFRNHSSQNSPYLMAWKQVNCENIDGVSTSSASDGDLDIAYGLLLAEAQWGNNGTINYGESASKVIEAIKNLEIDTTGSYIVLGDWSKNDSSHNGTRSADLMPNHFREFKAKTGDPIWDNLVSKGYTYAKAFINKNSPGTALISDFVVNVLSDPAPAPKNFLEGANDPNYGFNACRNPWRIGTDCIVSGDDDAKYILEINNKWIKNITQGDPSKIKSGYTITGQAYGSNFSVMSFISPFGVGSLCDPNKENQEWVNSLWTNITSTTGNRYYPDSLKMISLIVMSGNWWTPSKLSSAPIPTENFSNEMKPIMALFMLCLTVLVLF